MTMRIRRLGETAIVLCADAGGGLQTQRRIWSLAALAREWRGVEDAVAGMQNLTLIFDVERSADDLERRLLEAWNAAGTLTFDSNVIEVPVSYGGADGPDLPRVAAACGCTEADAIAMHSGREYDAYFLGFQPGFAYLGGLDERLRLPRRDDPRALVPAGSVAIAEGMTAIYPANSPGGWHLIGLTALRLFDVDRRPPSLIRPGDRVRFVAVERR